MHAQVVPRVPSSGSGSGVLVLSAPRFCPVGALCLVRPCLPSPLGPGFSRVTEMTVSLGFCAFGGCLLGCCQAPWSADTSWSQSAGRQQGSVGRTHPWHEAPSLPLPTGPQACHCSLPPSLKARQQHRPTGAATRMSGSNASDALAYSGCSINVCPLICPARPSCNLSCGSFTHLQEAAHQPPPPRCLVVLPFENCPTELR